MWLALSGSHISIFFPWGEIEILDPFFSFHFSSDVPITYESLKTHCLPNPGGKCLHSIFHATTPSSSCTLWSKPPLDLPLHGCDGRPLRGVSWWASQLLILSSVIFFPRSGVMILYTNPSSSCQPRLQDSYIAFNTMQLCTLRSGERNYYLTHWCY